MNFHADSHQTSVSAPFSVKNKENGFEILVRLPGVDPQQINLEFSKQKLHLRARRISECLSGYEVLHREFSDMEFEQIFSLSDSIDDERIEATCTDGYLKILLPLKQKQSAKSIKIQHLSR